MPDYGHDLLFGVGMPPVAAEQRAVVATGELADDLGLDLLSFQDHPYQRAFLDAWTLLSYLGAVTSRVRLFPNVANLPLRPPAVLARSAAALDILTGGRVELGLGAGAFLDPIVGMGGPERTIGQHVSALGEAITLIRALWSPGPPVTFSGTYYHLEKAAPGPPPAHPIGIWLGAYKRRMLELTGRAADGWIPSLGYARPDELAEMNRVIDGAAEDAGRQPAAIRRAFNINSAFAHPQQLAGLALEDGVSAFVLSVAPGAEAEIRRFAEEVAPAVREAVAAERGRRALAPPPPAAPAVGEAAREPARPAVEAASVGDVGRAGQQTLLAIHQHLREELARLREVISEVAAGRTSAGAARSYLNQMTMRQNYWTLGAFCAAYCRVVSVHHAIEDQSLFPDLRAADQSLAPIIERLQHEHEGIAARLAEIDAALVAMVEDESRLGATERAVDHLGQDLIAHLQFEEDSLLEPIGRLAIRI